MANLTFFEPMAGDAPATTLDKVVAEMRVVARGPGDVDTSHGVFSVDNCIQIFNWMQRVEAIAKALRGEVA